MQLTSSDCSHPASYQFPASINSAIDAPISPTDLSSPLRLIRSRSPFRGNWRLLKAAAVWNFSFSGISVEREKERKGRNVVEIVYRVSRRGGWNRSSGDRASRRAPSWAGISRGGARCNSDRTSRSGCTGGRGRGRTVGSG